jgi:hypothetical protein
MSVTKVTMRCGRAKFAAVFGLPSFGPLVDEVFFIVYPSLLFAITCKILRAKNAITGNFRLFLIFLVQPENTPHQEIEHVQS